MKISNIQAENVTTTSYNDITTPWHTNYIENGEALGLFNSSEDNGLFFPEN
jgi:hypothetical protein